MLESSSPLSIPTTLGILTLLLVVYSLVWYENQKSAASRFGMPVMIHPLEGSSYPFIGQLFAFLKYRPWDLMASWNERYGPIVCFPLLGSTMFTIGSPELLKVVLQSKIHAVKKDVYNTMSHFLVILGTGIVTSEDKAWLEQRVKMSHPLRKDILTVIPKLTLVAIQNLVHHMDKASQEEKHVKIGELLRHLTLQVISSAFLSLSAEESDSTLAKFYLPIVEESNKRVWHPYRAYMFFLPFWWKYMWDVYKLNAFVCSLIRTRWEIRRQNKTEAVRTPDVLDAVLEVYERHFDEEKIPRSLPDAIVRQFRDEMKTFMLAGHETSAAMMTWTLYELIKDETLTNQLADEATMVFSPSIEWYKSPTVQAPTQEQLSRLVLAEACLKESLRKYNVVPVVARRTVLDLRVNDYFVPKGSSIIINIQAVHRNPKYWPEPERYNPSRFLGDKELKPYTFLPFIAGPRNCLGQHLALLESKMVISMIVNRYKLSLARKENQSESNDPRHRFMIPVIPQNELLVRVKKR